MCPVTAAGENVSFLAANFGGLRQQRVVWNQGREQPSMSCNTSSASSAAFVSDRRGPVGWARSGLTCCGPKPALGS